MLDGGSRATWSLRIKEARSCEELLAVEQAVLATDLPERRPLQIEIAMARRRLNQAAPAGSTSGTAFASAYGLPAPTGDWLYRHRLSEEAFARLQSDLRELGLSGLSKGHGPGLFVLWAAEWFRRSYQGGGQRWSDLCDALGIDEDQGQLRRMTADGLRLWRRAVREGASFREYLGSLAREGGFPAAAVRDGGKGGGLNVLRAIVAPLLAEPAAGEERARALAAAQRERLPQLFRDDDFVTLCADLALAVVRVRREADGPAAAANLPVSAWLRLNRPDWAEALPIATGDRGADALIDALLEVPVAHGGAVAVERLLQRDAGGGWQEAVRLTLDGVLDGETTRGLDPALGRLRAFAAGEMARSLPGEIAMLEPPAEGESAWTVRATRRARGVQPLPFAAGIKLDLRAGEQSIKPIHLAGGKPRRGALLVLAVEEGEGDTPTLLRVLGAGSGKYRPDVVVLQAPAEWRVEATLGETATPIGAGVGATRLWRVTGGAFVIDDHGDRYRILCGQPHDEPSRIELLGTPVAWAEFSGDVDLFAGPPIARIGGQGELWLRAIGTREWQRAPGTLPVGHYEIGWRRDRVLLDRRRIAVLPRGAELARSGGVQQPVYELRGFGPCTLAPEAGAPVRVIAADRWRGEQRGQLVHWFTAHLDWPDGPTLAVRINHPCPASIARWDGAVLPNNARITLVDLPDLVAVDDGRVTMVGELLERGRKQAEMTWEVNEQLPMASVRDDLASLLLPMSIDAEVRLGMHDGIETWWRLAQFPVRLVRERDGIVASEGIVAEGATLVGRALARPAEEVTFGAYSLLTDANHRPASLPQLDGNWLVYLRAGTTILSRPLFVRGEGDAVPRGPLAEAMAYPQGVMLDGALSALLRGVEQGEAGASATIDALLALAASLNGLPPMTFRPLAMLSEFPGVLARLALHATPAQREAVLSLSDGLAFAWCLLPHTAWQAAQGDMFTTLIGKLAALGGDAPGYAKQALDATIAALVEREPLLGPVLRPVEAEPLEGIVQSFLNRAVERIPRSTGDRYRRHLQGLPPYFTRFDAGVLDTLDAPVVAARAVGGAWQPSADDVRHVKTVARTFPTYFAEMFAASLKEAC